MLLFPPNTINKTLPTIPPIPVIPTWWNRIEDREAKVKERAEWLALYDVAVILIQFKYADKKTTPSWWTLFQDGSRSTLQVVSFADLPNYKKLFEIDSCGWIFLSDALNVLTGQTTAAPVDGDKLKLATGGLKDLLESGYKASNHLNTFTDALQKAEDVLQQLDDTDTNS